MLPLLADRLLRPRALLQLCAGALSRLLNLRLHLLLILRLILHPSGPALPRLARLSLL